jgi:hypothetical protein
MTADWEVVPCLVQLRAEFNALDPQRPKGADGTIGDDAHRLKSSDHNPDETGTVPIHDADRVNEVHALDITTFWWISRAVAFLVSRCRSGAEKRLRYIIWDHTIYEASNEWKPRGYEGTDPHTGHAHFSASYDSKHEADRSSWRLADLKEKPAVALTPAENTAIANAVWATLIEDFADPANPNRKLAAATWMGYSDARRNSVQAAIADLREHLDTRLDAIEASLTYLKSGMDSLTDEPAPGA